MECCRNNCRSKVHMCRELICKNPICIGHVTRHTLCWVESFSSTACAVMISPLQGWLLYTVYEIFIERGSTTLGGDLAMPTLRAINICVRPKIDLQWTMNPLPFTIFSFALIGTLTPARSPHLPSSLFDWTDFPKPTFGQTKSWLSHWIEQTS